MQVADAEVTERKPRRERYRPVAYKNTAFISVVNLRWLDPCTY